MQCITYYICPSYVLTLTHTHTHTDTHTHIHTYTHTHTHTYIHVGHFGKLSNATLGSESMCVTAKPSP